MSSRNWEVMLYLSISEAGTIQGVPEHCYLNCSVNHSLLFFPYPGWFFWTTQIMFFPYPKWYFGSPVDFLLEINKVIKSKASATSCRKDDQKETIVLKAPLVFKYNLLFRTMCFDGVCIPDRQIFGQHNFLSEVTQLNIMTNNFILKQKLNFSLRWKWIQ